MLLLVHKSPATLERWRHPNLGLLISPRGGSPARDLPAWTWAADNDAFGAWSAPRFVRLLERIAGVPGCLFVAAPDVVGDASATRERFEVWRGPIREAGQPVALVAQDGLTVGSTPWDAIDALFIGGSTEWKMGDVARELVAEANRRGKWSHVGRVNSRRRIYYAKAIGARSVDGTYFSRWSNASLPWALPWAGSAPQMMIEAG